MPDKTELQLKAMEMRLSGLERSIDALKKASMQGASSASEKAFEKRISQLEQTMATKKDMKTQDELDQKQMQQYLAKHKAEQDQINLTTKREVAAIEKTVQTAQLEHRLTILDARLKVLEGLRGR